MSTGASQQGTGGTGPDDVSPAAVSRVDNLDLNAGDERKLPAFVGLGRGPEEPASAASAAAEPDAAD